MNLNIAGQMQALAESLTLARQAGIADDFYFQVLAKNVSYSGLARLKEAKLKAHDFSPQFSVKHMHKDMRLADGTGHGDLPLLELCAHVWPAPKRRAWATTTFRPSCVC